MLAALVLLVLPILQPPSTSPLTPSTRVRVTVNEPTGGQRTFVGPLRTFDSQMLTLTTADSSDPVSLSRSTITRIEVSRGRRSRAGLGLLIGAGVGLAAVVVAESTCGEGCERTDNRAAIVGGAVVGGGLLGAGLGAMMRSERWEALPWAVGPARRSSLRLREPLSLTVEASHGWRRPARSLSIGLSVSF